VRASANMVFAVRKDSLFVSSMFQPSHTYLKVPISLPQFVLVSYLRRRKDK
jgi:hypothetical protein